MYGSTCIELWKLIADGDIWRKVVTYQLRPNRDIGGLTPVHLLNNGNLLMIDHKGGGRRICQVDLSKKKYTEDRKDGHKKGKIKSFKGNYHTPTFQWVAVKKSYTLRLEDHVDPDVKDNGIQDETTTSKQKCSSSRSVSSNKVAMASLCQQQWSGNNTIKAEMQQQGCNVKKMESQQDENGDTPPMIPPVIYELWPGIMLFRAEHVPIQYGGKRVDYCDCNPEFTIDGPVAVVTVKPASIDTGSVS
ncbi:hypothetical protein Tco_1063397 [Tanacetum coccineum]